MRTYKVNLIYAAFGSFKNGYTVYINMNANNEYEAVRKVMETEVLWVKKIGVAFLTKNATAIIPEDITEEVSLNF